jgi:UDP-3-O-[3-hydroxymyristoyl] glucosamine N-acyltransferase
MNRRYTLADIEPYLGEHELIGDASGKTFVRPAPVRGAQSDDLVWIRPTRPDKQQLLETTAATVVICDRSLVVTDRIRAEKCLVVVENPKLVYSRIVSELFVSPPDWTVHPTAVVHPDARVADRVHLGPYTVVGRAEIGEGSVIHGQCFIYDDVTIGRNVTIHPGCVIGCDGFGFEPDEDGRLEKFPHVGGVLIEDDVEIQALTAIDRGSLGNTIIRRGAKIDNLVHIAHNVEIGEDAMVIAHAMLGGSVKVGARSWLGPGSLYRDNISLSDGSFIGIGALVVKDASGTEMGAPARPIEEYKRMLAALKRLAAED